MMKPVLNLGLLALAAAAVGAAAPAAAAETRPNIIFMIADDLGYGDLGCYGQKKIRTPNLDRLAAEGMRFTAHYSGHNVCAPSRCVLMTGKHPGHAYIRDNRGGLNGAEGQEPVPAGELRLPLGLKAAGYTLGGFGKWGLGPVGSSGDPLRQGFDRFYGFNCQAVAHNYYPTHLWDNDQRVELRNPKFAAHQKLPAGADPNDPASYAPFRGQDYAPDLITEQALRFLREHRNQPFFLYYPTTVPHLALQVPEDSLAEYAGKFPEEPYAGGRGYLPHRTPRAAYAAMVTRLDREVGRIMALVRELDLDERTIFVFTSDNGPLYNRLGGTDADFFDSAAGLRGRKGSYYEGGFRVPCIVRWKGRITPGATSDRVTGFEDWLPTLLELAGAANQIPTGIDGISFVPTLLGRAQPPRPFLYRESPGYGGQQCVRVGAWKAVRQNLNPPPRQKRAPAIETELYNLETDPFETNNVAAQHPDVLARLEKILEEQHQPSKLFPIRALDGAAGRDDQAAAATGESCAQPSPEEMAKAAGVSLPRLPWHLANIWWEFETPTPNFESLEIDVTIDRDVPDTYNLYIAPVGLGRLSGKDFYGGLQSNINGWRQGQDRTRVHPGKGAIFSRWSSDKKTPIGLDHVRVAGEDCLVESAGYEGEFASVRRPLAWTRGTYTYRISRDQTEVCDGQTNTWFACSVKDPAGVLHPIGSLRFEGGSFEFWARHSAFVEVYSTAKIPRSGIPKVNITFGYPRVNGRPPPLKRAHAFYPNKTGPAAPDCAWAKAEGDCVRVEVGPIFQREEARRRHDLPLELPKVAVAEPPTRSGS